MSVAARAAIHAISLMANVSVLTYLFSMNTSSIIIFILSQDSSIRVLKTNLSCLGEWSFLILGTRVEDNFT